MMPIMAEDKCDIFIILKQNSTTVVWNITIYKHCYMYSETFLKQTFCVQNRQEFGLYRLNEQNISYIGTFYTGFWFIQGLV